MTASGGFCENHFSPNRDALPCPLLLPSGLMERGTGEGQEGGRGRLRETERDRERQTESERVRGDSSWFCNWFLLFGSGSSGDPTRFKYVCLVNLDPYPQDKDEGGGWMRRDDQPGRWMFKAQVPPPILTSLYYLVNTLRTLLDSVD